MNQNNNVVLEKEKKKIVVGLIASVLFLIILGLTGWYSLTTLFLSIERNELAGKLSSLLDRARLDELIFTRDLTDDAALTAQQQINKVLKVAIKFHESSPDKHTNTENLRKLIRDYENGFEKNTVLYKESVLATKLMVGAAINASSNADALEELQQKYIDYDKASLKQYRKEMFDILENASLSYELVIQSEVVQNYEKTYLLYHNERDIESASDEIRKMSKGIDFLLTRIKNEESLSILSKIKEQHTEYQKYINILNINNKSIPKTQRYNSSKLTNLSLELRQNEKNLLSGIQSQVRDLEDLLVRRLDLAKEVAIIMNSINNARQADRDFTLSHNEDVKEIYAQKVLSLLKSAILRTKKISKMLIEDDEKEVFKSVEPDIKTYLNNFYKVIKIARKEKIVSKAMVDAALATNETLSHIIEIRSKEMQSAIELSRFAIIGGIIFVFVIIFLSLLIKNLLSKIDDARAEVEAIHTHTRDSIQYASLIQGAVVSKYEEIEPFFKDSFVHWIPKDTVGGDIWIFNELRHKDECLLFVIDCTGHGVPGAFVTMIVKSIEREITATLKKHPEFDISPAIIMAHFNKTMKVLLKQETKDSLSNAGWDGGIIYYNKRDQVLKFAGAETSLFYLDENQDFQTVKGNRYSVGYKKCDANYVYKETIIDVKEGMKFYCTTDGYLDQNGGEKGFPLGKKRCINIIKENHTKPMNQQKEILIDALDKYESMVVNNDRNDDITFIAFEIGAPSDFIEEKILEIVKYEGVMTQNVIASSMDNIETKITNISMMSTISTITIEYCQNMMNYSKNEDAGSRQIVPAGSIEIQYVNEEYYTIIATNIVSIEDKEKIEPKLIEIQGLDKSGIKKRYRELRKSGKNTHEKGGGIGMYEIGKMSDSIEYEFEFVAINKDKYYFTMKSFVKLKKRSTDE